MSGEDFDDELLALAAAGDDADIEEGEASSVAASSPNSLGSGDMDESDSDRDDGDAQGRDADVPYPLEGKYRDAKDKSNINAMPQLERERILGERADKIINANFQAELARRAREIEKTTLQGNKRKASSIEPDDSSRRNNRPKTHIEVYKQRREEKHQKSQRLNDHRLRSSSADRDLSDLDADGESEVDWDDGPQRKVVQEEQPANLQHIESIRVSRAFFSQVCFYPKFEETMTGTYVRVGTGSDAQRRILYKMAQIKGFSPGKPYIFEGKNGQRLATDQYVIAQHGSTRKEYQFQYLSNGRFTDTEFEAYKQSLLEASTKLPTQTYIKRKYDEITKLEDHHWTDADINARIAKAEKYNHLLRAKAAENPTPKIASQSELDSQRIAQINQQNRKIESERIRQALIDSKKADRAEQRRKEKELAKRKSEAEEKQKAEEEKLKSQRFLDVDALFEGGTSREGTPKPNEKKKVERKGLPTFRKPKMDDDIIASMDIGVDIEI